MTLLVGGRRMKNYRMSLLLLQKVKTKTLICSMRLISNIIMDCGILVPIQFFLIL
jgi:hypothetical protein